VGLEPTNPCHEMAVLKTAVYASSTTSARGGEHPKMLPVAVHGDDGGGPLILVVMPLRINQLQKTRKAN
jgi:hypothetical protein